MDSVRHSVSIHAPVKGRLCAGCSCAAWGGFNPRPREGATNEDLGKYMTQDVSIHAPVKGRPQAQAVIFSTCFLFQSTPP